MQNESYLIRLEQENCFLRDKLTRVQKLYERQQWNTTYGDVIWWTFPNPTKPYIGKPTDENFPKRSTHWQRIVVPYEPLTNGRVI